MADVPMVRLSGSALVGIEPDIVLDEVLEGEVAVCLGAILSPPPDDVVMLGEFMRPRVRTLPGSTNRRAKATNSLSKMYANDRMGCCVISGKFHKAGLLSANDGPTEIIGTDAEVVSAYNRLKAGPGDSGCMIDHVLNAMRDTGIVMNGKAERIDGYVGLQAGNKDLARAAIQHFGSFTIGVSLPSEWTNNAVWDITNSRIVGGHDVEMIDYDDKGLYLSSWGRVYLMTWAAYLDRRWVSERYVALSPQWYNDDKLSPAGVDVARLKKALEEIKQGNQPDIGDDPVPPPPHPDHDTLYVSLAGKVTAFGIAFPAVLAGKAGPMPAAGEPARCDDPTDAESGAWLDKIIELILMLLDLLRHAKAEQAALSGEGEGKGGDEGGADQRQREGAQRPVDRPVGDSGALSPGFDRRARADTADGAGAGGATRPDGGDERGGGGAGGVARAETGRRRGRTT